MPIKKLRRGITAATALLMLSAGLSGCGSSAATKTVTVTGSTRTVTTAAVTRTVTTAAATRTVTLAAAGHQLTVTRTVTTGGTGTATATATATGTGTGGTATGRTTTNGATTSPKSTTVTTPTAPATQPNVSYPAAIASLQSQCSNLPATASVPTVKGKAESRTIALMLLPRAFPLRQLFDHLAATYAGPTRFRRAVALLRRESNVVVKDASAALAGKLRNAAVLGRAVKALDQSTARLTLRACSI